MQARHPCQALIQVPVRALTLLPASALPQSAPYIDGQAPSAKQSMVHLLTYRLSCVNDDDEALYARTGQASQAVVMRNSL